MEKTSSPRLMWGEIFLILNLVIITALQVLQLHRGGYFSSWSSSATVQFLGPPSHWCLEGQLLPESHMQKLRAMDLTLITAFMQSRNCHEGAIGNLVLSMAQNRRDWTKSFRDAQIPRDTSRATHAQTCMSRLCKFFLKAIFCRTICSHLKDPKSQGVCPTPIPIFGCTHS